jgi:hypothetical protein
MFLWNVSWLSTDHTALCSETSIYRSRICRSISMVPERILFKLWLPHLLFSQIHCFFFRPPTKTKNRGFTVSQNIILLITTTRMYRSLMLNLLCTLLTHSYLLWLRDLWILCVSRLRRRSGSGEEKGLSSAATLARRRSSIPAKSPLTQPAPTSGLGAEDASRSSHLSPHRYSRSPGGSPSRSKHRSRGSPKQMAASSETPVSKVSSRRTQATVIGYAVRYCNDECKHSSQMSGTFFNFSTVTSELESGHKAHNNGGCKILIPMLRKWNIALTRASGGRSQAVSHTFVVNMLNAECDTVPILVAGSGCDESRVKSSQGTECWVTALR